MEQAVQAQVILALMGQIVCLGLCIQSVVAVLFIARLRHQGKAVVLVAGLDTGMGRAATAFLVKEIMVGQSLVLVVAAAVVVVQGQRVEQTPVALTVTQVAQEFLTQLLARRLPMAVGGGGGGV